PDPAIVSPKISQQVFEKNLRESYNEVLLDDLELLREFCATRVDDKSQSAAEALRALPFLPPRATLAQFLEQTHAALAHLDWKQHALELASVARDWSQCPTSQQARRAPGKPGRGPHQCARKPFALCRAGRTTRDRVAAIRCTPRIGQRRSDGRGQSGAGRCAGALLESERMFYRALSQN